MKKFEIMVATEQGEKKVDVCVDDITGGLLEKCNAEIQQIYLEEEYKAQKRDRAETRRHISLEHSIQTGHDYESSLDSPEQEFINKETRVYKRPVGQAYPKATRGDYVGYFRGDVVT